MYWKGFQFPEIVFKRVDEIAEPVKVGERNITDSWH